jgi:hypothetical protein
LRSKAIETLETALRYDPENAAPWEIQRADLEAEPVRGIVERLQKTGKLILGGSFRKINRHCFNETNKLTMRGIMSASSS